MKRIIKVVATYDLDAPELKGAKITPVDRAKEITEEKMVDVFCCDDGYESVKVEVIDMP